MSFFIDTSEKSGLYFHPIKPMFETNMNIIRKKYAVFLSVIAHYLFAGNNMSYIVPNTTYSPPDPILSIIKKLLFCDIILLRHF